ncbi:hypothetical protein BC831DRAFT_460354 [Entophlyctis helioformis]|nr:hypothetical protein BC831DRAFT_460354 [Entophlyctis helioformis]
MLRFDEVCEADLADVLRIEQLGFPPEEAATLAKIQLRHRDAPHLFIGAYDNDADNNDGSPAGRTLVGFINATATVSDVLTHESMSCHDPRGATICIHSVCVDPSRRRQGVALALLAEFRRRLARQASDPATRSPQSLVPPKRIALAAHDHLVPLYVRAGYTVLRESPLVHGPDKWIELQMDL